MVRLILSFGCREFGLPQLFLRLLVSFISVAEVQAPPSEGRVLDLQLRLYFSQFLQSCFRLRVARVRAAGLRAHIS